jgi:hypothetical protein
MGSEWNRNAHAGFDGYDLFPIALLSPYLTPTGKEEPDFFYGAMGNGD